MKRELFENRLLAFVVKIFELSKGMRASLEKNIITNQILRSSFSVALNYAESESAESKKDFIHKLRISLKEMRETNMALKIINEAFDLNNKKLVHDLLKESNELIAIFVSSINTATMNLAKNPK